MFLTIGSAAVALYLYRRTELFGHKANSIACDGSPTCSEAFGELGERLTQAKLRETLNLLCGDDYYLHDGPLILIHAHGSQYPTIEIDHFAVTPFGVFVLETKHWSGKIELSKNYDYLTRALDGIVENRKSPLAQNKSKLSFLRTHLPAQWPVAGAGVFTSPEARLSPHLSSDIFVLNDLPQWLRTHRDRNASGAPVDITKAVRAIMQFQDRTPNASTAHKLRITHNYRNL
jgi:hypothetical protein